MQGQFIKAQVVMPDRIMHVNQLESNGLEERENLDDLGLLESLLDDSLVLEGSSFHLSSISESFLFSLVLELCDDLVHLPSDSLGEVSEDGVLAAGAQLQHTEGAGNNKTLARLEGGGNTFVGLRKGMENEE